MEEILSILKSLGIDRGDVLFVSSDITRLFWMFQQEKNVELSVDEFIDGLQALVGESGTLIFPTYNWSFCKGETWDYHKTKCLTGSLGIKALKRSDFRRTQHPIYSFAVWGKDQDLLCSMNNVSSFGIDSPFAYFDKVHAKNLVIDVVLTHCFTFVHYVEQLSGIVTYRYEKNFTADYTDADGNTCARTYSMFVRDLDLDVDNDLDPIDKLFLEEGIAKRVFISDIPITLLDLHASVAPMLEDIRNNRSRKLCKYIGQ